MAITREKKQSIASKLTDIAKVASVVFVNFKGLKVNQSNEMRKKLKEQGISYFVAKKTLTKRAFNETNVSGEMPPLEGELAIVYGEDPIAPAREISSFAKKFDNAINILGGIFENRYMSKSEMKEIASIPGVDVLRGMFVNVINSPIQRFVIGLKAIADKKEG
jgi:large subunit ribosomal protein L10